MWKSKNIAKSSPYKNYKLDFSLVKFEQFYYTKPVNKVIFGSKLCEHTSYSNESVEKEW